MEQFEYKAPKDVAELVSCLKNADDGTFLLSGGTDLIIKLRSRGIYSGKIIDMSGISELKHIIAEGGWVKIGANVTFTELGESDIINAYASCLGQAARQVGSRQIRNTARLAGNLANSSPRGDSIPALFALGARIRTINGKGETALRSMEETVLGIGRNSLEADEAIIEILIPCSRLGCRSAFGKYGRESSRTTVVIANVNAAAVIWLDSLEGIVEDASIVIGSAAPVPYHAEMAERVLRGSRPSIETAYSFVNALREHVTASINGVKRYENKIDEITGIGMNIYGALFGDMIAGGDSLWKII
jgi:xanthine dehydrogenase FAD-binding subunit